ncbi:hypothetical protein ABTB41_20065, partial [Acinetobacter baumannii]
FTSKLVTGAWSRFFIRTLRLLPVISVDVCLRPERGVVIESSFRSLFEIAPLQLPVFGCTLAASDLRPAKPLIFGRTVIQ